MNLHRIAPLSGVIVLALVLLMASMASASTIALGPPVIAGGHDSTRDLVEPLLREELTKAGYQVVSGDADLTMSTQARIAAPFTYHLLSGRRSNGRCWLTTSVVNRAGQVVSSNVAYGAVSDKTAARTAAGFVSEFAGVGMLTGQLFHSYQFTTWSLRGAAMGGVLLVAPFLFSGDREPLEQLAVASAARKTCQKLVASLPTTVALAPTPTQ